MNDASAWLVCVGIICLATFGKLGGSSVVARLMGLNWHDAFSLGALMNTRGLVELIALNIGYDLGILSPAIFTMMVLMALVTTFMTSPLLNLADYAKGHGALAAGVFAARRPVQIDAQHNIAAQRIIRWISNH